MSTYEFTRPASLVSSGIERARIYLHPGHSFSSATPTLVTTILGSCISVCLTDPIARIGGLTHYVVPSPLSPSMALEAERVGTTAIVQLVDKLAILGALRHRFIARVFGGASMLQRSPLSGRDLGTQNADVAFAQLAALGIPVASRDTGGTVGRKLIFETDTGEAWVKLVESQR